MIGLLDANNFFVSCERAFRPDLGTRPVAVLSNNDGCIIARSNEVKALGIPMGAPYYQVKKILDAHHVCLFSSNFSLYGDMSCRMMNLLHSHVPKMEVYSIDEAFIDFSGISDVETPSHHIRNQIWRGLGIPTSLGIAKTKTLAKVANHLAKKVGMYQSVCILTQETHIHNALKSLKVGDIWGIGRRLSVRLQDFGIHNALQLKDVDPRWMRRHFTVVGERLIHELNGNPCLEIEDIQDPKKSIQVSRSFAKPVTDFDELRATVATYATRLSQKLRKDGLKTRSLMVEIRTNHFRTSLPQYRNNGTIILPCPVEDDLSLIKATTKVLERIFRPGFAYHKAGVMAFDLLEKHHQVQLDLFTTLPTEDPKSANLTRAIDQVNQRFGRGTLLSAACGKRLSWKDQKKNVSPAYTTCWEDLPKAFAQ
jgi:DNA polymerase V